MCIHKPWLRAAGIALGTWVMVLGMHVCWVAQTRTVSTVFPVSLGALVCVISSMVYTLSYEYWWHRIPMHRGAKIKVGNLRSLAFLERSHTRHHQELCDEHFRTRNPLRLAHVTTHPIVFPVLFLIHYSVLLKLVPHIYVGWCLSGITLQFLLYETNHWLTHVEGNSIDNFLRRIPFIRQLRAYQIKFHKEHHDRVEGNFGFSVPPPLWDTLMQTKLKKEA